MANEMTESKYEVKFTDLAEKLAANWGGIEEVEKKIRTEIDKILIDDLQIKDIMYHTVSMTGSYREDKDCFVCRSDENNIIVDARGFIRIEVAGKSFEVPAPIPEPSILEEDLQELS